MKYLNRCRPLLAQGNSHAARAGDVPTAGPSAASHAEVFPALSCRGEDAPPGSSAPRQAVRLAAYLLTRTLRGKPVDEDSRARLIELTESVRQTRQEFLYRGNCLRDAESSGGMSVYRHAVGRDIATEAIRAGIKPQYAKPAAASLLGSGSCDEMAAMLQIAHAPWLVNGVSLERVVIGDHPGGPHEFNRLRQVEVEGGHDHGKPRPLIVGDAAAGSRQVPEPAVLAQDSAFRVFQALPQSTIHPGDASWCRRKFEEASDYIQRTHGDEIADRLDEHRSQPHRLDADLAWPALPIVHRSVAQCGRAAVNAALEQDKARARTMASAVAEQVLGAPQPPWLADEVIEEATKLDRLPPAQ